MHEGGLPAVSRAESAVHHMDSTVCPHGGGWHRLRLSCWGSRAAMTTVATGGALTISTAESAVAGLISR
jgi:hypothetical protein